MKVLATRSLMLGGDDFSQRATTVLEGLCREQLQEATGKSVLKNELVLRNKAKELKEVFALDEMDEMIVDIDFYGGDDAFFSGDVERGAIVDSYADLFARFTAFVEDFFACVVLVRAGEA